MLKACLECVRTWNQINVNVMQMYSDCPPFFLSIFDFDTQREADDEQVWWMFISSLQAVLKSFTLCSPESLSLTRCSANTMSYSWEDNLIQIDKKCVSTCEAVLSFKHAKWTPVLATTRSCSSVTHILHYFCPKLLAIKTIKIQTSNNKDVQIYSQ